MLRQLICVGFFAAMLGAPSTFAQTAAGQTPAPAAPSTPAASAPDANKPDNNAMSVSPSPAPKSTADADSNTFVTQQSMDQWRASKLAGINVYGPDNKKVGSVKDVLVDHDGNAKVVVISVGGFLGIGSKDVAVPFKSVQWRTESRAAATNPPPNSTTGAGTGATPSQGAAETASPAKIEASQGYPDRGILAMTEEQLKGAPEFHYASDEASPSAAPAAKP